MKTFLEWMENNWGWNAPQPASSQADPNWMPGKDTPRVDVKVINMGQDRVCPKCEGPIEKRGVQTVCPRCKLIVIVPEDRQGGSWEDNFGGYPRSTINPNSMGGL